MILRKGKRFALKRKRRFIRAAVVFTMTAMALLLFQKSGTRRTYVITDGSRVVIHTTSATDPELVLQAAGLELDADDTYTAHTERQDPRIQVSRCGKISINYYGRMIEATARGETVEELLARLNLPWNDSDTLSLPPRAQVFEGMELTVSSVVRENQSYTAILPHETVYCSDPSLPEGTEKTVTEGVDGEILCEAAVTYINGKESERQVLNRQVISQPVAEIIACGTAPAAPENREDSRMARIGDGTITLPTGEVLTYTQKLTCLATAYHCEGYVGTTATGTRARVGAIAVDPKVFPYGTRFYIVTQDGEYVYGIATAEDCGSKEFIHDTRLDLFFNTRYECIIFGARNCDVYILG